ncbi:DUF4382 domain-containing protein [Fodinibius halophilus]|uniref:DUF4382 domain-containing protein n=1 Tax=Fodinibius halophilus TaxID=1736908 RepID=A0A6M1T770_9BACT|nr:DUF4382 domain-containing protein [Fodinibius halophilus]NGP89959.1 DUF4382 domain-containing protein [Fodinibius halophilus]
MLNKKLLSIPVVFIIVTSMAFVSCNTSSDGDTGTMTVEMSDAPIDSADAVNVFIESVEVESQDGSGWVTLNEPQKEYNLLELINGATSVIGSSELEAGTYNQIRLILSGTGHSVVVDGKPYAMKVPGGQQTGVKLSINVEIEPDIEYVLLLDFDVSNSVVKAGKKNPTVQYLLQPVIDAKEKAITGNIAGAVEPVDSEPVVYAIANSDTLASTIADTANGEFKLIGLEEGTYDVSVNPRNSNYGETVKEGVSVTTEQTSNIGTITVSSN